MSQIETKLRRGGANKQGALSTWAFAGIAGICLGSVGMSALAAPPNLTLTVPGIRAEADPDMRTKVVRYGELNLQSDEAIVILYKRIASAADYVCSPTAVYLPVELSSDRRVVEAARKCVVTTPLDQVRERSWFVQA